MKIFVLDDGETWTLCEPTAVVITPEQLTRLEGGEKFYHVVPDWHEQNNDTDPDDAEDFFVQAGIAAAEALKEMKRDYTKSIVDAQNKEGE
jgi:hypothetical protein